MVDAERTRDRLGLLSVFLDERLRRLVAAAESVALGYGGVSKVSRATGVSRRAITEGVKELQSPPPRVRAVRGSRVRREGGGRKKVLEKDPALARELERLVLHEGFLLHAGGWEEQPEYFARAGYPGVVKIRKALEAAPKSGWAGFQLFYPMRESEVRGSTGLDLVESMLAVFREVTPAMNLCMQIELADQYLNRTSDPR